MRKNCGFGEGKRRRWGSFVSDEKRRKEVKTKRNPKKPFEISVAKALFNRLLLRSPSTMFGIIANVVVVVV